MWQVLNRVVGGQQGFHLVADPLAAGVEGHDEEGSREVRREGLEGAVDVGDSPCRRQAGAPQVTADHGEGQRTPDERLSAEGAGQNPERVTERDAPLHGRYDRVRRGRRGQVWQRRAGEMLMQDLIDEVLWLEAPGGSGGSYPGGKGWRETQELVHANDPMGCAGE